MNKLLRDYLKNNFFWSKVQVQIKSYRIEGNNCICIYSYSSDFKESSIYDDEETVNIWDLLDYTYNKISI